MTRRRSLGVGCRALLDQDADLLGLGLEGGELSFEKLALQGKRFLRVLGLDQLVRQIEGGVDILFGVAQRLRADRLGVLLCGLGSLVGGADGLLSDRNEALERLARLIDATFGEIAKLVGNFKRGAGHGRSRLRRPLVGGSR